MAIVITNYVGSGFRLFNANLIASTLAIKVNFLQTDVVVNDGHIGLGFTLFNGARKE